MGANPADTHREITRLRGDINAALDEVDRRVRGGVRGVMGAEAPIPSPRTGEQVIPRARENPPLLGVAGVVVAGALAYGGYNLLRRIQERSTPQNRLRRGVSQVRGGL